MPELSVDFDLALSAFVTFFVVVDPLGVMPIFAGLTSHQSFAQRALTAVKGVAIAAGILLFFAFAGEWLLQRLHVSMPAFKTAGGLLLLLTGIEMILERRTERRTRNARRITGDEGAEGPVAPSPPPQHEQQGDISVFPLAIPLLAGPGAIASVMLLMTTHKNAPEAQAAVLGALALVLVLSALLLIAAVVLFRRAGSALSIIMTRLMGILLAALSVQYIFDGIREGLLGA